MVSGKRIRIPQWLEGRSAAGPFVVRVEAEAIIPDADASEPCFEPTTVRWLEELQRLADDGQIDELSKQSTVYIRCTA
jgi:hypothetical protein